MHFLDLLALNNPYLYIVVLPAAIVFSILVNRIFLGYARKVGFHLQASRKDTLRWAGQKPLVGGISFFLTFLLGLAVYGMLPVPSADIFDVKLLGLTAAVTLGFLLGLADDSFNLSPTLKFLTQILAANILFFSGYVIEVSTFPFVDYLFSLIWVVGIMNSINMLDNMDGITTIVSISICLICLVVLLMSGTAVVSSSLLLIMVVGALLGFLMFNWNPAEMYMGDTGSQFLGVFLAAMSIHILWPFRGFEPGQVIHFKQFVLPLIAFVIPIIDTTTVFIRRIARGQSPFIGGKDHTTHHLAYLGLKDRQVAIVFAALSLISIVLSATAIVLIDTWHFTYTLAAFLYFVVLFSSIQYVYFLNQQRDRKLEERPAQKTVVMKKKA